jgi:hypothetical protein
MSNNDTFQIGSSNYDRKGGLFSKKRYFYVKANEPNIYRVLPPVLSLARTGEYYKYHAVHRNMRASDGKQRAFVCIEDVDYKTKIVKVRCPVCDVRRQYETQYNNAKELSKTDLSITKEKLQEFWMAFIEPLKVERNFYMNVANQAGEIGILPVNTTFKNDMHATFKKLKDEKGIDPSGNPGIFVNFSKVSQYKGDNKPACKVDPVMETVMHNNIPMQTYKFHECTPEFIGKMKTDCQDLSNLHRTLTVDEMAQLASADREARKVLLDTLFSLPEAAEESQGEEDPTSSAIPGVAGAVAVARVDVGANGMKIEQPVFQAPSFTPQAAQPAAPAPQAPQTAPASPAAFFGQPAAAAPAAAAQSAPAAPLPVNPAGFFGNNAAGPTIPAGTGSPAPTTPAAPASKMSDSDFMKHFMAGRAKT